MLEGISIFVLLLWICSRKSVLAFFFHQLQQIFQMKYFFQLNILRLFISNFLVFSFFPSHPGKRRTATNDDIIQLPWKQSRFYLWTSTIYLVYGEGQRSNHAKLGLYEVYGFVTYLDLPQVTLLNWGSLQVNKPELGLLWLLWFYNRVGNNTFCYYILP